MDEYWFFSWSVAITAATDNASHAFGRAQLVRRDRSGPYGQSWRLRFIKDGDHK